MKNIAGSKSFISAFIISFCVTLIITVASAKATTTIATFADPTTDSSTPLFRIDLTANLITGGWTDSQTNLNLNVVYTGYTFADAFFEITPVTYTGGLTGGDTSGGTIKFFKDGDSTIPGATPLIQIDFEKAYVMLGGFGGLDQLRADGVTITGSEIGSPLTDESFVFSFANQIALPSGGYTATSAFAASGLPEPVTVLLLGLGMPILSGLKRKR